MYYSMTTRLVLLDHSSNPSCHFQDVFTWPAVRSTDLKSLRTCVDFCPAKIKREKNITVLLDLSLVMTVTSQCATKTMGVKGGATSFKRSQKDQLPDSLIVVCQLRLLAVMRYSSQVGWTMYIGQAKTSSKASDMVTHKGSSLEETRLSQLNTVITLNTSQLLLNKQNITRAPCLLIYNEWVFHQGIQRNFKTVKNISFKACLHLP